MGKLCVSVDFHIAALRNIRDYFLFYLLMRLIEFTCLFQNSSMEIDDSPLVAVNDTEREASKAPAETRENLFDRSKGGGSSSADASMKVYTRDLFFSPLHI